MNPYHDPRHAPYCWCRWAWTGNMRWSPAARTADSPTSPQDLEEDE